MRLRLVIAGSLTALLAGLVLWPGSNGRRPIPGAAPGFHFARGAGRPVGPSVQPAPASLEPEPCRVANTRQAPGELARSETAILLENALVDTALPISLSIPESLRANESPGAYIVQARGIIDPAFRSALDRAGATTISYIPNNAYLVSASSQAATRLKAEPRVSAILAYEPYYKLKRTLLKAALEQTPLPEGSALNALLFPGARDRVLADLQRLGISVVAEERSPFGPVLRVVPPAEAFALPCLARLAGVQEIEVAHPRAVANDLSRAAIGIATDSISPNNYLGLTGSNVLVNINDTGVDTNHPDLKNRVLVSLPLGSDGTDPKGHGTHVAGIIAGDGTKSPFVGGAKGSVMPGAPKQFRGKAPAARLFSMNFEARDSYLQETAALTNAYISNNSWNYQDNGYDLAAASYDAAVRDALPEIPGSQPLLYVFPAGNSGALNSTEVTANGPASKASDTILSPATAKNVITVGAVEQSRGITNLVTLAIGGNNVTTAPWSAATDSGTEVASFSGRGNVGIGVEGEFGRFKPDVVAPGVFVVSTRPWNWEQSAYYDPSLQPPGTALQVLSNLNEQVGPFYRYESGCSMAAAEVSGTLALMQELFIDRLKRTNSPALMKALVVNGARPLENSPGFRVAGATNHQGWGIVNLTNSLPRALTNLSAGASSMLLFDQSPTAALATAEQRVLRIAVAPEARSRPLRITLAWTDPPANPLAGLKLVNDLDLVVTNLSERTVYLGNDIPPDAGFNQCGTATTLRDVVNNIENVYLQPPLAAAYSIAVIGRRVNVNAVAARMDVAQDYALVVASGNGEAANALSLLGSQTGQAEPGVVTLTNVFGEGTTDYGAFLTRQVAGDNSPALPTASIPLAGVNGQITLGSPAQWRFYTITNQGGCTNAAFFTFNARTTSYVQTAGTNRVAAVRADADVDLYVSTDPALTNLHPVAVASAEKSLSRGGNEMVVLSNAVPAVYYLGVKSETMRGVEFGVAAIFGEQPFSDTDSDGNLHVRGIPTAKPVPDGAPYQEPAALVFAIADRDLPIHRVIVTNSVSHSAPADLVGILSHDDISVVLNNHAALPPGTHTWVFDDSAQLDMLGAVPSAGPGSLRDFVVHSAYGAWVLSQTDTVPGGTGTNDNLGMFFEREQDLTTGVTATILPGACREDLMYVPVQATNLTLNLSLVSGTGPVLIEFCPLVEANECLSTNLRASNVSLSLALDAISDPPLHPGTYVLRCCNTGADPAVVDALAALTLDPGEPHTAHFRQNTAVSIVDDGLTWSTLTVTNVGRIAGLNVGVGIEHPRVSDLEISLLSPAGTRVLLAQNRGGLSEEGLGLPIIVTTEADKHSDGGPAAYTNTIDTAQVSGIVSIRYAFYSKPDSLRVYYEGNRIFDSGMVSLGGVWTIPYGPGTSTKLTIVVNEGNNYDPETLWDYWFTSTKPDFLCAEFTEDANLTVTPIKFAIPPFTNALATGSPPGTNGIYFLPEESLEKFKGEIASGDWRLEITDTRAGAIDPNPMLVAWQLCFLVDPGVPLPLLLSHGMPRSQTVRPGHFRFFVVDVPSWASFTTNSLLGGSGPVLLLFNRYALPFGTNAPGDLTLLTNTSSGSAVLGPGQIAPENSYFLTVQNTSSVPVTFVLQTDFETPALSDMVPREFAVPGGQSRYFAFDVSPDALRASVMLTSLTANGDLVVQKGVPLPTLSSYDYASFNPETNSELILLVPESTPVPLSEGRWYVGVFNMDATNLTGTLLFNQLAPPAGTIVITDYRVENDSLCLTWTSLPGRDYLLQGRSDLLPSSQWVTLPLPPIAASGNRTSTCVPFSAGYYYLRVCEAP